MALSTYNYSYLCHSINKLSIQLNMWVWRVIRSRLQKRIISFYKTLFEYVKTNVRGSQRHSDRRTSTTACTKCTYCWAMGTNKAKKCAVRKIIFCISRWAAKTELKSIVPAQRTNQGWTSFICTPRFPICLSFNSQHATPLWSLWGFISWYLYTRWGLEWPDLQRECLH